MALNYSISIDGNKVFAMMSDRGKPIKKAYGYIMGKGEAKDVAQAVSYATARLYHDWKEPICTSTQVKIDEDELIRAINAHNEEMKK